MAFGSSTTIAPQDGVPDPPERHPGRTALHIVSIFAFIAVMAWAWHGAEIRPWVFVTNFGNTIELASDFVPPNFHDWKYYCKEMLVTVQIALWGSVLAVVCAIPLGLLAAGNIAPIWIRQPTRRVLDCFRAIHEVVFALLFVVAVGLGPFAGVLALWVHTTGILGKLFSEVVEAIDPHPVEGIRATGANHLEEVIYGVIPQVLPMWISYALYRFESNVRSATILGIVGAGGIGLPLYESIRSFAYPQAAAVLIIVIATVVILDMISAQIRRLTI
jgi:phosphonate transport system permease protein